MFRLNRIAVDFLSAEIAVDGVEVEAVVAREKTEHLLKVLTQLIDAARFAGVVTRHGKTATERARAFFESDDIIALPAVQRDWSLGQDGESLLDINADRGVHLFGFVIHECEGGCILRSTGKMPFGCILPVLQNTHTSKITLLREYTG